jgi:hypothetical protein
VKLDTEIMRYLPRIMEYSNKARLEKNAQKMLSYALIVLFIS